MQDLSTFSDFQLSIMCANNSPSALERKDNFTDTRFKPVPLGGRSPEHDPKLAARLPVVPNLDRKTATSSTILQAGVARK